MEVPQRCWFTFCRVMLRALALAILGEGVLGLLPTPSLASSPLPNSYTVSKTKEAK